jgi:hypothetical protein
MNFRDLWEAAVKPNNEESALYVFLIPDPSAVRIASADTLQTPAVREHGAREAIL